MANTYFQFKKFVVYHDRCAMKVGTDGVLLGAWARVGEANQVLDIGTGTGLIALMMAQRNSNATITGVELEKEAASQALENVQRSPWQERIQIICMDIRFFAPPTKYDVILSNPPYFESSLKCSLDERTKARHTETLNHEELLQCVRLLLDEKGEFSIVIPTNAANRFIALAASQGLFLSRRTWVHTLPHLAPKRVLLAFSKYMNDIEENNLIIETEHHLYTAEYKALTKDFYLSI